MQSRVVLVVAISVAALQVFMIVSSQSNCPKDLITLVNSSYILCSGNSTENDTLSAPIKTLLRDSNDDDDVDDVDGPESDDEEDEDRDERTDLSMIALNVCVADKIKNHEFIKHAAPSCFQRRNEYRVNRCLYRRIRRVCPDLFWSV